MRSTLRAAAIGLALAASGIATPAMAQDRVLAPTDEWRVISRAESCVVMRNFVGPNREAVRLQFQRFAPSTQFKVTMNGEGMATRYLRAVAPTLDYRFDPDSSERETTATLGTIDRSPSLTFYADLVTPEEIARADRTPEQSTAEYWTRYFQSRESAVRQLRLAYTTRGDTVFDIGAMGDTFRAFEECTRALVTRSGYDLAVFETLRTRPRFANLPELVAALENLMSRGVPNDNIHFRLGIDAQGKAESCIVQYPNIGSEFAATVCQIVRDKGRFEPATGADGNPVRAPFFTSMRISRSR